MPAMDGLMLAKTIHERYDKSVVPLILLTSSGRQAIDNWERFFVALLSKPIKPSQLYNALIGVFAKQIAKMRTNKDQTITGYDPHFAESLPLRILLAEDHNVNRRLALLMLKKLGYVADVAMNGVEAVQAVFRQRYDVILMDVQMPEMDGLMATQKIKRSFMGNQSPYIIAITANASQEDKQRCLKAGMDDYISKPFKVEELTEALVKQFGDKNKRG